MHCIHQKHTKQIITLSICMYAGFLSSMETPDQLSRKLSQSIESYDLNTGEDNDIDRFNFTRSMESLRNQEQIQSFISQKRIADAIYATFLLITATATICNVIWEEPTLNNPNYFGARALNIGNKINTAVTLGLSITHIMWLLKSYCACSIALQEDTWANYMIGMHVAGGISRSIVATMIGICGGVQHYPRTLIMLIGTGLLDFVGIVNVENHREIDREIEMLQNVSH